MIRYNKIVLLFPWFLILIYSSQIFVSAVINQTNMIIHPISISEDVNSAIGQEDNYSLVPDDIVAINITEKLNNKAFQTKYLESSIKKNIPLSRSLTELVHQTPKSLWGSTEVNVIVTFNSKQQMSSQFISKYDPVLLDILPIALFKISLNSINNVKSIPGVTGVYLDKLIPLSEEYWDSAPILNSKDIMTYPWEDTIGARNLQNLGINGTNVSIAILDTGIDKTHPDLDDIDNDDSTYDPKVILEASFVDFDADGVNDTTPMDDHFHGTHVAGIAAGNGYLRGVAPGASILNGKVLDKTIGGYTSWIVKGIDWAVSNGADIISMSLGGLPGDIEPLFESAISAAWESGTIVITSAGNSGPEPSSISSPGLESRTITVGASNIYNDVAFFSSRGPSPNGIIDPDIVAPGRGILSLAPGGHYTTASGTSMAAPAVAGVAALLLSSVPEATPDEVRSAILSSAADMGKHVFTQGSGLINATAALEHLYAPSIYCYPSFSSLSPLKLSPGEYFEYQFDVYLNQTYSSLNIKPSIELEPYVNVSMIDSGLKGWIRARVNITMSNSFTNGIIMVSNGSKSYYNATLCLWPDKTANDAGSGTDAGETFVGALPLTIGVPISGENFKWDRDIYSFPVDKNQIYLVELYNLTGNLKILITNENGTIIKRSSNPGRLPEKVMFKAQSSGYYFIRIEDQTQGEYVLHIRLADEGELLTFNPAYLTGKIGSSTTDKDSDSLFDELIFYIEVNVSVAGDYDFWYSIAQNRPDYYFGKYVFMWDWLNLTLEQGIQNLTISVPGGLLESSGFNGSYVLNELALGKNDFSLLIAYDFEVFVTPSYSHTSFDTLDHHLESIEILEKDIDGNGIPEMIIVELEFYFSTSGVYGIGVPIFNENQNERLAYNTETIIVSQPGLTTIRTEFVAQKFERISDIALFGVVGSWYRYLIPVFNEISKEMLVNFDPIITYSINDHSIDLNNNGQNETMRLTFFITSKINTVATVFTGHVLSYPNETMLLINSSEKNVQLKIGANEVWIDFEAKILNARNLNGPFFFPGLGLTITDHEMKQKTPYISKDYNFSSFEPALAKFSKFFGGKLYNSSSESGLEIKWEIISKKQVEVRFEVEVRNYEPIQGEFSKMITFNQEFGVGTFNITCKIEGDELYNSTYIGGLEVYSASIFMPETQGGIQHRFQEHNLSLIDFTFHAGILPSINYHDYDSYVEVFFVNTPQIFFQKTHSQNIYDGIFVNVTVGVNTVGTYELSLDLFSENEYLLLNIRNTTSFLSNEPSNISILFFFTAETLVRKGFDKFCYGNISIKNEDSLTKSEIKIPHFTFNISNYNYSIPVNTTSKVFDYPLDSDQDGKFDHVAVTLLINVTRAGNFGFSLGFYSQLSLFYEAYLGNVTLTTQQFTTGFHNITFHIPYYYFLSIYSKINELDMGSEIKIFMVPLFSIDDKGIFLISAQPSFLTNKYDLSKFYIVNPLSIGLFTINQKDNNADGIADALDATVSIIVYDILSHSIDIELDVFWFESFNKKVLKSLVHKVDSLGVFQSTISFPFSEIFTSTAPPSHYTVTASVAVVSDDGIQIDSYVTPVNITFETEMSISTTIQSSTEISENGKSISPIPMIMGLALSLLAIVSLAGVLIIYFRRMHKA